MFKNIVLATDFSDHSLTARKAAIPLAQGENKKLTVLNVIDVKQKFIDEGVLMASELVEAAERKKFEKEAEEKLSEFCEPIKAQGLNYESLWVEGKAAESILSYASKINADLIIIGSHSKRGFIDVSLGGVARKVGEEASCPVLIVTHYKEEPASAKEKNEDCPCNCNQAGENQ